MKHILIVDDKEENLYYLRSLLTGHGFAVESARHGAEALVLARQNPPDLVISDLLMPVMDGYTLLRHWKADTRLRESPFIVYTATYTEAEDEQLALSLGADAFILKPAEPDDFLSRLRDVQSRTAAPSSQPPRQKIGDETALLKVYSETLIRKLEEKTLQLEEMNHALQLDIAERRRVEENLRESEERFRATFEQAAVGIAHVSVDGTFLRVNDKLCEICGYTREEMLRRTFMDLTVPEDRAEGDDARRAMLAGTLPTYSAEKRYQRKDGRPFWVGVVTALLRDPAGRPKYFIAVITDITERKILQEQFLRAQRMESIGTLAGGIAHDLNNLLAPIVMGIGLIKHNAVDPDSRALIETIERSAQRGTDLVKQVLSFARGVESARARLPLGSLARETESFVVNTFPKNISFERHLPPDLWPVVGDATQINQVLLNLCVNARDAMPDGGRLVLKMTNREIDGQFASMTRGVKAGRYVVIEVSDNGCGISPELQDRIFEPFFSTKGAGHGSGLGLSTTLGIVRSHGGHVTVDSLVGQGSTFRVYLPALRSELPVADVVCDASTLPRGNGELVLVVDDEASILDITKQTLQTFGYRVVTAKEGAQAISLFAQHRDEIAVVITDMMMPVMDGKTLIAALRRLAPRVLIIATSGYSSSGPLPLVGAEGVDHFLPKPFSADVILLAIHRTLASHVKTAPTPVCPSV